MSALDPRPEHKFAFGLGTMGHTGRDPFGSSVRRPIEPYEFIYQLSDLGAWGVSFHDDDLMPTGATAAERHKTLDRFAKALAATGIVASMATTNLFRNPAFKDGAFTSSDIDVRRFAIQKTMRAIDLGVEMGTGIHVVWGGREGGNSAAAKPPIDALDRYREAINFLCGYVMDQGYELRFALEPQPNDPCGGAFLPTVGHALAFIETLDRPEMVGVNPDVAHETMAGLSLYHAVAQAIWSGKLFHIDLSSQRIGRHDHDLRFDSEGIRDAFFLIKLLEESRYDGPRHFHASPIGVEDAAGIWDFAAGCMRTYLALAQKARRFADDYEIQDALKEAGVDDLKELTVGSYSSARAGELMTTTFDPDTLASSGYRNERLDQLVVDLILGLR